MLKLINQNWLSGVVYGVAYLSKKYQTLKGIILASMKSIGQFIKANILCKKCK